MAQCEKILDTGERCSNQAVPGSRYCQTHGRITFRPVKKPADTAPPPPPPPPAPVKAKPAPERPRPAWKAVPSPAGQAPSFPGLHPDERNILVAPQGIIWLEAPQQGAPLGQFNRLVRLMGFLSQAVSLPGQVRLLRHGEAGGILLYLSPAQTTAPSLSVFYDAASAAARLVDGRLYIGQGNAFVQYRDDGAPRGYDVPAFKVHDDKKELLLVAHWGSRILTPSDLAEVSLAEFCLQVVPLLDVTGAPPEEVYALIPPSLYPALARYFRAHHLRYSLARLQSHVGEIILFEISPRQDAPAGQAVPSFVLDYLARLPRVALLVQVHQAGNQRILLQWRHRYPLHIPHVAAAFAPDDLVLLVTDHYPNLRVNPAPQFFNGDQLMDVHAPQPSTLNLKPRPAADTPALRLPVLLLPDNGPTPPIAALILATEELIWLRQLLYRLPGEAFSAYSLCQGQEGAVLVGGTKPIEGIPFGLPLRRLGDTELFIPLRSHFVPNLPWEVLRHTLEIQDSVYTFLTADYRLDLPVAVFSPLSRALAADPNRPRVKFNLRTGVSLPDVRWTQQAPPVEEWPLKEPAPGRSEPPPVEEWPLKEPAPGRSEPQPAEERPLKEPAPGRSEPQPAEERPLEEPAPARSEPPQVEEQPLEEPARGRSESLLARLSRLFSSPSQSPAQPTSTLSPTVETKLDLAAYWHEQARAYEDAKDFLAAAVCYSFLNDVSNSARCYRLAAVASSTRKQQGE